MAEPRAKVELDVQAVPALGCLGANERTSIMINEKDVLAALDKPRTVYSLQQRLDPSNKSTDALQDLLMRMRSEGEVKFNIKTGKWSKNAFPR